MRAFGSVHVLLDNIATKITGSNTSCSARDGFLIIERAPQATTLMTHVRHIVAIFYPFSQFCEINVSLLSLQKEPNTAPNLFQRGVEYGKYGVTGQASRNTSLFLSLCNEIAGHSRTKQASRRGCASIGGTVKMGQVHQSVLPLLPCRKRTRSRFWHQRSVA